MNNKFLRVLTSLVVLSLASITCLVAFNVVPSQWYYSISELDLSFQIGDLYFSFMGMDFVLIHVLAIVFTVLVGIAAVEQLHRPTSILMSWFYDSYGCKRLVINKITNYDGEEVYRVTTVNGEHIQDFTWFNQAQTFAYSYMVANYDIF